MTEKESVTYGELEIEGARTNFAVIRAALLKSADRFAQSLVDEKLNADGEIEDIDAPLGTLAAAFLTADATRRLELDSKKLLTLA
jgi:hypothetical protein